MARALHSRAGLPYGSDLTDAEWAIIALLPPKPCDREQHRRWRWREVLDAIFYVLSVHPGTS
jgi:transposase